MSEFTDFVENFVDRIGRRDAAEIRDALIEFLYPLTKKSASGEGCLSYLRNGVREAVKNVLDKLPDQTERSVREWHQGIMPFVEPLLRENFWVEELGEFLTIRQLAEDLKTFNSARKYMRRKGIEVMKTADRMDALYTELKRRRSSGEPIFEEDSNNPSFEEQSPAQDDD